MLTKISMPRCHQQIRLWLSLICLLLVSSSFSEPIGPPLPNVQAIKAYLSEQSSLAIAVVRFKNGSSEALSQFGKDKVISQFEHVIFQGARQDDNFYVRQVCDDLEENEPFDTNTVFAVGRSEETVWHAGHAGSQKGPIFIARATLNSKEIKDFFLPQSQTDNVVQLTSSVGGQFIRFLHLGLIDTKAGTFRFDGNKFKVQLNRGREAEGELLVNNGLVDRIKYKITGDSVYVISELSYGSENVPDYLPDGVIQKVYNEEGVCMKTNLDFQFLRITLSTNKLDPKYFLPDRFDPSVKDRSVWVAQLQLTNGVAYQRINGGGRKLSNAPDQLSKNTFSRPFFYFGLIISGAVLFFLVKRTKNNENKS
jgi:hypothetical protein